MTGEKTRSRDGGKVERTLLNKVTSLAKQVSRGNYTRARKLFELTKAASYPRSVAELVEAFGMMIVKVESRAFKLEQMVEDLEQSCKALTAAKKTLEAFNRTLEQKITVRTGQLHQKNDELSRALHNLKGEIRNRKQAEKHLSQFNRQIEETSRKLQDAYLWMRQQKDHWKARQYKESMIFLTAEDGRIRGFTEKALEMTNKSRSELQEGNIQDIFRSRDDQSFSHLIRQVRPNIALLTTLGFKDRPGDEAVYEAKLTSISINGKRLTYIVLYEPPKQ